ncbi:unnamed protein product [Danaus chrysippus]|uniref:(African queen) hypothetical protein n=1 Tax=Danaus chrysippus TaxID=151541 RepID=A0A8J2QE39_9NEOP|nr:unnamed protein product [Danaus chrysippus]
MYGTDNNLHIYFVHTDVSGAIDVVDHSVVSDELHDHYLPSTYRYTTDPVELVYFICVQPCAVDINGYVSDRHTASSGVTRGSHWVRVLLFLHLIS